MEKGELISQTLAARSDLDFVKMPSATTSSDTAALNCVTHNIFLNKDGVVPTNNVVNLSSKDFKPNDGSSGSSNRNSLKVANYQPAKMGAHSLDSLDADADEYEIECPRVIVNNKNPNFEVDVDVNVSVIDPNETSFRSKGSRTSEESKSSFGGGGGNNNMLSTNEPKSKRSKRNHAAHEGGTSCWWDLVVVLE